jgi:hypothetical protein
VGKKIHHPDSARALKKIEDSPQRHKGHKDSHKGKERKIKSN